MRRLGWLAAVLLASGCSAGSSPSGTFGGSPSLPAAITVTDAPPLPSDGPLGPGVLIYTAAGHANTLLLADGRQFRLPHPPAGEGRQGSLFETLSPDGRWLGLRTGAYVQDRRYVLRELTGATRIETTGRPVAWSTNGRYLLMTGADGGSDDTLTVIEPATGHVTPADRPPPGLGLTGLLADRSPLFTGRGVGGQLRWQVGGGPAITTTFVARPDDDGWTLATTPAFAADGTTVSVQLAYQRGLVPGTTEKATPAADQRDRVAVLDAATGAVRTQWTLPQPPDERWQLAVDTGAGLIFRVGWPITVLVVLDRETGRVRARLPLPPLTTVLLPGEHGLPSDG